MREKLNIIPLLAKIVVIITMIIIILIIIIPKQLLLTHLEQSKSLGRVLLQQQ